MTIPVFDKSLIVARLVGIMLIGVFSAIKVNNTIGVISVATVKHINANT